jgi:hypothetical protein
LGWAGAVLRRAGAIACPPGVPIILGVSSHLDEPIELGWQMRARGLEGDVSSACHGPKVR